MKLTSPCPTIIDIVWLVCVPLLIIIDAVQGDRSWQPFGEGKNGHKNFRQACIYYFRKEPLFLRTLAILQIQLSIICIIYHVIVYFLPNTIFDPKENTYLSKDFRKVCESRQILISRQNSICQGLTFSSRSKLFSEGPSCHRTTSATLMLSDSDMALN